jgi:hypothetical protein
MSFPMGLLSIIPTGYIINRNQEKKWKDALFKIETG